MKTFRTRQFRRAKSAAAIEPLEDRIAPASTVTLLASGDITVLDGNSANDTITISLVGANLHFFDPNGIIAGSGATQQGANNAEVPANALLGKLIVNTGSEPSDRVTFAPGLPLLSGVQVHTQTLTPLPGLAIGTNGLDLTTTLSPISINGTIDAGSSSVTLHSASAITTSGAATVIADGIDATAVNGISLRMDANSISATNTTNGGIALTESNTVAIISLNPGPGGVNLASGAFTLGTNNALAGVPDISVDGILDLNGFNTTIGALNGSATGNVTNSTAAPATLFVGANSASAVYAGAIGGNLEVVKTGSGDQTFSGLQSYPLLTTNSGTLNLLTSLPNATINNNGGVLNLSGNDPGTTVNVNAVTNFGGGQLLAALNIGAGGFAFVNPHAPGGNPFVIDTQALTFVSGGKLDLTNNAMIVRGGDVATITAQIASGYAVSTGGYWDGPGINSSAAANDPLAITALGALDNNDFGYANLAGVPLSSNGHDVLVRFTYYGDADLNGVVDGVDFGLTDQGAHLPVLTGWLHGDFNYDGAINATDVAYLDNAYVQQAGGPGSQIHQWTGAASTDWFDPANWTNGVPGAADTAVLANFSVPQPQLNTTANVAFFDHIDGILSGTGVLNVAQGMNWLGGNESGGSTALAATASLTLAGTAAKLLDARTLTLPATTIGNNVGNLFLDNGGILQAGASISPTFQVILQPGGGMIDTNGFNIVLDVKSSISGTGSLTKTGAGTLVLGSVNSYNGTTAINSGILTVSANNQLSPTSDIFVNGGTLAIGSFDQPISGAVTLTTGSITGTTAKLATNNTITINGGSVNADLFSASSITINNGNVNANLFTSAAGSISLNGGTWTLRSTNTTSGTLFVTGGVLDLKAFTENVDSLNVTGGTINSVNGTLQTINPVSLANAAITANVNSISDITVNSGTIIGNLNAADNPLILNGGTVTYTANVGIASGLVVNGGSLSLGANNVTFGDVTVNTGSVTATTGILGSSNDIAVNGGTVTANFDAGGNTVTLNGGTVTPNTGFNIASILDVNGGTLVLGTKTATLGGLTFEAGSITGTGAIISATDYILTGGTLGMKLAGNVGLTKNGPGTAILTNTKNSFTGTVTINDGSLQIASNGALGNLANALDIEGAGTLITTASITSARHIIANGAAPTINVTAGTVTLNGVIDGTGALQKTGPGTLVLGNNFVGTTVIGPSLATTSVGGSKVKFTGPGTIMLTVVSDGMGGTRISTVELADTDATTILAINGPKTPATTTIDTIKSLDPNDEIGTIKLGKTVIVGNGVNDAIADVDIRGKVNKLLFNDVNSYTLFELGKGLPYNNIADDTTPDSYNNHPDIKLRTVLGTGVTIDVTGDGVTPGDMGGIGGGGLGKVIVDKWDQPGLVKTTQSIGRFKFKHGDCNVVFEVDKDSLGTLTTAGIGKMLVPNGAWGSSGSIVEGGIL